MKKKKKRKKSRYAAYVEDYKRWVTMDELMDYQDLVVNGHSPLPTKSQEENPAIVRFIKSFFSLNDGIVIPCQTNEGYYNGLVDFLVKNGKKKSAKIMKSGDIQAMHFVQQAWREYRQENPRKFKPLLPLRSEIEEPRRKIKRKKQEIHGHDSCAFIRRLALEGYKWFQIKRVTDHFRVEVTEKTIKAQIWCAKKKGKYGLPAPLSKGELKAIKNIVIETRPKSKKLSRKQSS